MPNQSSSPNNIRTNNRRKVLKKTWKSPEWKKAVKEFVNGKHCEWCGSKERLTAHHPFYSSGDVYLDFYLSGCMVLCNRCHFALHKGLTLCPSCRSKYCRNGSLTCYDCFILANPGIAEEIQRRKDNAKLKRRQLAKEKREKFKRDQLKRGKCNKRQKENQ